MPLRKELSSVGCWKIADTLFPLRGGTRAALELDPVFCQYGVASPTSATQIHPELTFNIIVFNIQGGVLVRWRVYTMKAERMLERNKPSN